MNIDLGKALEVIQQNLASAEKTKIELATGPAGPRGENGSPGDSPNLRIGNVAVGPVPSVSLRKTSESEYALDFVLPAAQSGERGECGARGIPGPEPKIRIGNVVSGDEAQADIRRSGDGYELNLTLPRGRDGKDGRSISGPAGKDGESIKGDTGPAGRDGKDGESVKGEKGDSGMSREEIAQVIVEILGTAGVLSDHGKKLVEIRTMLRKKVNQATVRNIAEIADLAKAIDAILDN